MNYKLMGRFISKILMVEAVFMVPAMLISLWEREYGAVRAFMWTLGGGCSARRTAEITEQGVSK